MFPATLEEATPMVELLLLSAKQAIQQNNHVQKEEVVKKLRAFRDDPNVLFDELDEQVITPTIEALAVSEIGTALGSIWVQNERLTALSKDLNLIAMATQADLKALKMQEASSMLNQLTIAWQSFEGIEADLSGANLQNIEDLAKRAKSIAKRINDFRKTLQPQ